MHTISQVISATVIGLGFAAGLAPTAALADRPNILIVSEDADEHTVPRGNRIFNRVLAAMSEDMNVRGYNVYDETAVSMGFTAPGRVRRKDTELIEIARAIPRPPIDVVSSFQIYASVRDSPYADVSRPEIRVSGRMLNTRTGQFIAAFEEGGFELPPLPVACKAGSPESRRECLLEHVGAEARTIARGVAAALVTKLDGFRGAASDAGAPAQIVTAPAVAAPGGLTGDPSCTGLPTAYVIVLDSFTSGEITAAEEYLRAFKCYEHHRPLRVAAARSEYWYETKSDAARLNRNLRLMLETMRVNGNITLSGNQLIVTKIATR